MKRLILLALALPVLTTLQGQDPEELRSTTESTTRRVVNYSSSEIGLYFWGEFPQGTADPLGTASRDIKALGSSVARTAITPYWSALEPEPDLTPLDQKVYKAEYLSFIGSVAECLKNIKFSSTQKVFKMI